MKVKNKATGKAYDIEDSTWDKVKDEKHVKGVLIPVSTKAVPAEVAAQLSKAKDKKTAKEPKEQTPTETPAPVELPVVQPGEQQA